MPAAKKRPRGGGAILTGRSRSVFSECILVDPGGVALGPMEGVPPMPLSRVLYTTLLAAFIASLFLGCAKGPRLRVDDSLLAALPAGRTQGVIEARSERDKAKDAENQAERAIVEAQNELRLVRSELDVARSEHDQAKTQVGISRSSGDPGAIQSSEDRLAVTTARVEERRRKVTLYQRKVELARARYEAARRRTYYKEALVELAKARAVQGEPGADDVSVSRFELQASEFKTRLAREEQEVASVGIEVEEAERAWREALARVEALSGAPARAGGN